MYKEQGLPSPEELANDIEALNYAAKEDIPFELVFKGFDKQTIPSLDIVDGYFENPEEQFYHGIVTGCFASAPSGSTEDEARKLINYFLYWKQKMAKELKSLEDKDSLNAAETVGMLSLKGILDYTSCRSAQSIVQMPEENTEYWDGVKKVARLAVNIYGLSQDPDPNLDPDLV